jgi:lysophospholipid acyltransferase (LPLAT)-like uncharacterized protein
VAFSTSWLVALLARLYAVWLGTLRVRILLPDGTPVAPRDYVFASQIFALCERDLLAIARMIAETPFVALVALGRDGDWATAAAEALGCRVVRGSSRRGGTRALSELVRTLSEVREPAALVVDGPLGPSGQPKEGVLFCAAHTGRPVVPAAAAARHALVIRRSWSHIFVPMPFSRVAFVAEEPLILGKALGREESAPLLALLAERLARARARALREVGRGEEGRAAGRNG